MHRHLKQTLSPKQLQSVHSTTHVAVCWVILCLSSGKSSLKAEFCWVKDTRLLILGWIMFRTLETGALFPFCTNRCLTWSRAEATVSEGKCVHQSDLTVPCDSEDSFSLSSLFPSLAHSFPRVSSSKFEAHTTGQTFLAPFHCSFLPGASVRNSACDKGQEEGGSAYTKVGLSLRSPPGNSRASTPKTRVCLLYGFVLSPTPLTLRGAVPHHLSLEKS